MQPTSIRLSIPDSIDPTRLMGPADANLRRVEAAFEALVSVRGNQVLVSGSAEQVDLVTQVFSRLIRLVEAGECPQASDVDLLVDQVCHGAQRADLLSDDILLTYRGRALRPKTAGQKRYIDAIRRSTITFGIGPAGTGKTYLAMAMAVAASSARRSAASSSHALWWRPASPSGFSPARSRRSSTRTCGPSTTRSST